MAAAAHITVPANIETSTNPTTDTGPSRIETSTIPPTDMGPSRTETSQLLPTDTMPPNIETSTFPTQEKAAKPTVADALQAALVPTPEKAPN